MEDWPRAVSKPPRKAIAINGIKKVLPEVATTSAEMMIKIPGNRDDALIAVAPRTMIQKTNINAPQLRPSSFTVSSSVDAVSHQPYWRAIADIRIAPMPAKIARMPPTCRTVMPLRTPLIPTWDLIGTRDKLTTMATLHGFGRRRLRTTLVLPESGHLCCYRVPSAAAPKRSRSRSTGFLPLTSVRPATE